MAIENINLNGTNNNIGIDVSTFSYAYNPVTVGAGSTATVYPTNEIPEGYKETGVQDIEIYDVTTDTVGLIAAFNLNGNLTLYNPKNVAVTFNILKYQIGIESI